MNLPISRQLKEIGIPETRAKVYEELLKLKKASALEIARKTGLLRTTVYENLVQLRNQHLVSESYEGKRRFFVIETPDMLLRFVKQKEQTVRDLLPSLFEVFQEKTVKPKIRAFEGSEGMKKINEVSIHDNQERLIRVIGDYQTLLEYLSEWYTRNHVQRRVKTKIRNQVIITTYSLTFQTFEVYVKYDLLPKESILTFLWKIGMTTLRSSQKSPKDIHSFSNLPHLPKPSRACSASSGIFPNH